MVREKIMLGHKISHAGLEVELVKIDVVSKLSPLSDFKPLRSFLGHAESYRRFIQRFSQISKPLSNQLFIDQPYDFDEKCNQAFQIIKDALTSTSIFITQDSSQQFKLMSNMTDVAVVAMLGQKKDKVIHSIYYAGKIVNEA
ncbi:Retrovirus-related Pol polyprotein from transposon 412 family [Cucumis melo var. makuwa]|uniref:Retrovirus-related Pol polyprotein from transposon 412 family n=1 Tax=Cucumis melo var. makuwa TaxID=1194695 RepID=A0A5D3C349_CUCMM|nr:Retrovirus-related Pol polyprotein from transposon 412 family [Cucumis melo var. makuwa]TYK06237.1 Retrovirus-related Pol polyprotein from transposon 412 family [Cucumis melo var. makuwa]